MIGPNRSFHEPQAHSGLNLVLTLALDRLDLGSSHGMCRDELPLCMASSVPTHR